MIYMLYEHDIDVARTVAHLKAFRGDESEVEGKRTKKSPTGHGQGQAQHYKLDGIGLGVHDQIIKVLADQCSEDLTYQVSLKDTFFLNHF